MAIPMFIAYSVVAIASAVALAMSAALKLQRHERVVETIHATVGVPLRYFPALAALEIAGAIGLVVGLWIAPIAIAAAIGVVLYFVGAIGSHVRVGDTKGIANPAPLLVLGVIALVLRIASS